MPRDLNATKVCCSNYTLASVNRGNNEAPAQCGQSARERQTELSHGALYRIASSSAASIDRRVSTCLNVQLSDGLSRVAMYDRLDLTEVLVDDARSARVGRCVQAAAGRRHEDAGEVSSVVEPGAVQVVLRTERSATVQLPHTHRHRDNTRCRA